MSPSMSISWPYPLDPVRSDPSQRRPLLDAQGTNAQIASAVAVVCGLTYHLLVRDSALKQRRQASVQSFATFSKDKVNSTWLTGAREQVGDVLLVVGWAAGVVALVLWGTGDDYLHLTRAPAQVGAALLPFHLLLSLPQARGLHLGTLPLHRLSAILLFALFVAHGSLYINYYVQKGLLLTRIRDIDVQLGLALQAIGGLLWFSGARIGAVRKALGAKNARWAHALLAVGMPLLLYLHVAHAQRHVWWAVGVWGIGQGYRLIA